MVRFLLFLFILTPVIGVAQILDDTTQVSYGPLSARYLNEADLRFNNPEFQYLDTTILSTYKMSKPEQSNHYLENLGVEGTPNRHVFYEIPETYGVSTGFNAFHNFFKRPSDFRYYDTRAPYSRLSLFLGGGNRSITDIEFSRSDSVLFNVGFSLQKWAIDKQQAKDGRGDKIAESTQYDIYTHIKSKNLKYQLLANFSRTRQIYTANGGVDTTDVFGNYYDSNVGINLVNANADDLTTNLHLFHQYNIRDQFEIYNSIDKGRQRNQYTDDPLSDDALFYDHFYYSESATADSTDYHFLQYEFGVKGTNYNQRWFYDLHFRDKRYDFYYKYHDLDTLGVDSLITNPGGYERYLGFNASYRLPLGYLLSGGMEFMNDDGIGFYNDNTASYASLVGKYIDVTYKHAEIKPSFLQQNYVGNHSIWMNNFRSSFAQSVRGRLLFKVGPVYLSPTFRYDQIKHFIYFTEDKTPGQAKENVYITSPGFQFSFRFLKHFTYEGNVVRSQVEGDTLVTKIVPTWFVNSRLFYDNMFFEGNLELSTGFDVHYKSAYYGDNFAPDVQQFYIQRDTSVGDFPVVTFYVDFRINRANFVLKLNNIWPNFSKSNGYLVAPLYPGLPQLFDFGFNWRFFD